MKFSWILLLVLFVPVIASQMVTEYTVANDHKFLNGTFTLPVLHNFTFEVDPIYDGSHQFSIDYRLETMVEHNSAGTVMFGVFLDGIEKPNCRFFFETLNAGGLTARVIVFNPNMNGCFTELEFNDSGPHTHTVEIREVASSGTLGTIHSWNSDISVNIKEETGMTSFENVTGVMGWEFIALFGVFIAFWFIRFKTNDLLMEIFSSIMMWVLAYVWLLISNESGLSFPMLMVWVNFLSGSYLLVRTVVMRLFFHKGTQL